MNNRASGILLHISSLPSPFGIGDLGREAYRFVDFLKQAGQTYWQILPLNPTDTALGNSPYSSCSALASNTLFISPEQLVEEGFVDASGIVCDGAANDQKVDYSLVTALKAKVLERAFVFSRKKILADKDFKKFCTHQGSWLENYCLFLALKSHFNGSTWTSWPADIRNRHASAVDQYSALLGEKILKEKFFQYLFYRQWSALRKYANAQGVKIIGDLPIYVQHDSVDVWANPENFQLQEDGSLKFLAGVPPDYFSQTGQLWGNPVYDWDVLQETDYAWWKERLKHNFALFDIVRIDHFRGFVDFWQVPSTETTAVNGMWGQAPAEDFFNAMLKTFKKFPIIAEDLGFLSDDVKQFIKESGFPGMKILLFAFDSDDDNPYLPHNHIKNCVVYTGTHDNNTAKGWFAQEATDKIKQKMTEVLGAEPTRDNVSWQLVTLAMRSVANTVIVPMQDLLDLDETCRMNIPGTAQGNWQWRMTASQNSPSLAQKFLKLTQKTNR